MTTPDQIQEIIDALPESKRKRALVELARRGMTAELFWDNIKAGQFGEASKALDAAGLQTHADAVWEG